MSTSTSLNTAAPSGSLNAYAAGAGAEPAGAAQAPAATAPHADPLAKLASLFGLHAAATTQRASGAAPAPTYGGPGKTSLRECSESGLSDAPTTKVQPGETSLEQVAERLGFDAQDLARINPRIKDPAALSVGQDIRLPQEAKLSARADVEWPRCPTDTNADPRLEVAEAHRIYKETGEVPQTRNPLAAIEIQEGRLMSRAERYDAMLAKQGKTFAGIDDLERDDRDPGYVTRREFVEEASARHTAAYNACKEDNIRPGTIYNCIQDLAKRDGPQRYRDAREAQERLTWQQWQHAQPQIGAIASSGPLGLIGRGVGHAIGGLKGQEAGGEIGGMADAALSFAVGARQMANQRSYGTAGSEPGTDPTPPRPITARAANDNQAPIANDNQQTVQHRMAVGDSYGGPQVQPSRQTMTAMAGGGKRGDDPKVVTPSDKPAAAVTQRNAAPGDVPEPKILRNAPPPAASPVQTQAASAPPATSNWGNWKFSDLMTGSPYKPTQRDIYRSTVEDMADAMKAKSFDWSNSTLDPIIVDTRGKILQGHHRIVAARLAGEPIPASAIKTVPEDTIRDSRPWDAVAAKPGRKP